MSGIYEYWQATRREAVRERALAAIRTIGETVDEFRVPGDVSLYCLKHGVQSASYHGLHISQLDELHRLTGDDRFAEFRDVFRADYDPDG
ncbi:D-glucuronyl C5-epimerase family protein [Halopiger djelfimassiliensis]|uniref:D-glucuronyl C5-epimerase family protein n=1 Tax=Halopiger djelfimassiliensis TaxID=1293047 RepID=UPI0018A8285C